MGELLQLLSVLQFVGRSPGAMSFSYIASQGPLTCLVTVPFLDL